MRSLLIVSDETPAGDPEDIAEPPADAAAPEERLAEAGTEVSRGLRSRRSAFFREVEEGESPLTGLAVEPGGRWSTAEADRQIRAFLIRLAGDRRLDHQSDPVELARQNDLLLLFGPEEEEAFARLALRFPEETVQTWATLLSGGDASEAFGPRSRAERRDEAAIGRSLQLAFRRRVVGVTVGLLVVAGAVLGVRALWIDGPLDRSDRALRFSATATDTGDGAGGPALTRLPVAATELVALLDTVVAVAAGEGPREARVQVDPPDGVLPLAPGVVAATVFGHHGGQVALLGPTGWATTSCVRVSVVDHRLRPLDAVVAIGEDGTCPDGLAGRPASVTCHGDTVVMLAVDLPQGEVAYVEGGGGWAEAIRVAVEFSEPGWESLSLRGVIAVDPDDAGVVIPVFGGVAGDEITVDLGVAGSGQCTLQ